MKKLLILGAVAGLVILSGCSNRIADLTVASTKSVTNAQLVDATVDENRATGEDTKHIILFIPTGNPSAEEAMDKAIESIPCGIALKDATLTANFFWIPYIYGQSGIEVEGNVMQDSKCLEQRAAK